MFDIRCADFIKENNIPPAISIIGFNVKLNNLRSNDFKPIKSENLLCHFDVTIIIAVTESNRLWSSGLYESCGTSNSARKASTARKYRRDPRSELESASPKSFH